MGLFLPKVLVAMKKFLRMLYSFFATVVVVFSLVTIFLQSPRIIEKISQINGYGQEKSDSGSSSRVVKKEMSFFPITSLAIPIYTADSSFRRVVMDFRMASYHEHLKSYFEQEENIPLLYDRLNSKLAPMALEFPLKEEGKRVIKEKVRREINQLVRELELEGEIEEVYIDHVLAA